MSYKILYIEDNIDNKNLIQRTMEAKGYTFIWAANGMSGVELAETHTPDVILVDINLPDIDGYSVTRKLRANQKNLVESIPIIAITAYATRGDAEKALAAGCDVFISKPINLNELWSCIDSFLANELGSTSK